MQYVSHLSPPLQEAQIFSGSSLKFKSKILPTLYPTQPQLNEKIAGTGHSQARFWGGVGGAGQGRTKAEEGGNGEGVDPGLGGESRGGGGGLTVLLVNACCSASQTRSSKSGFCRGPVNSEAVRLVWIRPRRGS